jgi:hypothetical protein
MFGLVCTSILGQEKEEQHEKAWDMNGTFDFIPCALEKNAKYLLQKLLMDKL